MSHCYGCKRPLAGPRDSERWRAEIGVPPSRELAGRSVPMEPAWSRALCWSAHNCAPLAWADVHHETQAEHAVVAVTFYRSADARGSEVVIPTGTRVGTRHARAGRETFETIDIGALGSREVSRSVLAVALLPGNVGNVAAGAIVHILSVPARWMIGLHVTNDSAARGGRF